MQRIVEVGGGLLAAGALAWSAAERHARRQPATSMAAAVPLDQPLGERWADEETASQLDAHTSGSDEAVGAGE